MKNSHTLLGCLFCTIIITGAVTNRLFAEDVSVSLVNNGEGNASIAIAADPTPAANLAAIEFQYFIEKISGAKLPIVDDTKVVTGNRILIGESRFTQELGLDASGYHQMESLIKFLPDTVVLLGRDDLKKDCRAFEGAPGHIVIDTASTIDYAKVNGVEGKTQKVFIPGMFDYQGSLRATYRFLQDWCDVRFFGPSPINIHMPQEGTLTISGDVHHHRSGLDTKIGALGINGRRSGASEYGPRSTSQQHALYSRRMRWGGEPWYVNHTFEHFNYKNRFIPPVRPADKSAANFESQLKKFEKNTKAFERVIPGLHPTGNSHQFCYSTEGLIKQIAQDARNFFDGKMGDNVDETVHNLQGRGNTFFLVPFDVGGYCQCEKCKPLQDIGRGRAAVDFNTGESSDYVFSFVNAVAREVAKTHPDKHIGTLAYEGYYWAPKSFEMERNVTMTPCVHPKFWGNCPETYFKNEFTHYKNWVKLAKDGKMGPMGMWNYDFDVPRCATAYYAHARGEYVKMFLQDGVRHIFHCGAPPMLEMYVTNRLYENPELDINELVDDFFDKYFGPASKPMKELQVLLEDYTTNPKHRPLALQGGYLHDWISLYEYFLTDEHLTGLRKLMNEAKALAPNKPYASRLQAWEATVVSRYEAELPKHFAEKAAAERKAAAAYDKVTPNYISGVTAFPAWHWYSGRKPAGLVDGVNMKEATDGQQGTKNARLTPSKGAFRWNSVIRKTGAWILFDLGAQYELDEMNIWNYNDAEGNTRHGMRDIEIAYAATPHDLFEQNWTKLPNQTLNQALKEGKDGADSVIEFGGKHIRYIYIHTLGAEGIANWAEVIKVASSPGGENREKNTVDSATGMGGSAFDNRKFTIGLGQVRFYGTPLQLPKPEVTIIGSKVKIDVQGYGAAEIRYSVDGSIPSDKHPLYREPIAIDSDVVLRAKAFGCGLDASEYNPVALSIGDIVVDSAVKKSLTEEDVAGVKAAFLGVELYDSDVGSYQKHLQINGKEVAPVPESKENKFELSYISIQKDMLGSLETTNRITFFGGRGDAYKLRNLTFYVQLQDGSWLKSETDSTVYCSQSIQNWSGSEGTVMNPIEMSVEF